MSADALADQEGADGEPWQYMHAQYQFHLMRTTMVRDGKGEAWLSFDDGTPLITLKGSAESPRFGKGTIAIFIDAKEEAMYTQTTMEDLKESECLKYSFPKPSENEARMKVLRSRMKQIFEWEREGGQARGAQIQWTRSYELDFVMDGDQVQGFSISRTTNGTTSVVKSVRLDGKPEIMVATPDAARTILAPPAAECRRQEEVEHPLARVDLAPHKRSSALNDLLLLLAAINEQGHPICRSGCGEDDWSAAFVTLSVIAVPGDISVMIEEPKLVDLEALGSLSFDYSATVFSQGESRTSGGSIWMNLADHAEERSFRMRGEANQTKVGPLTLDVIARAGERGKASWPRFRPTGGKVYANVNLSVQEEHQCMRYDYPNLTVQNQKVLADLAEQGLSFFTIAELNGEDCGIFVAELARGAWIHLWVDMDAEKPYAVLRSEVHKEGRLERRVEVLRWRADDVHFATTPPDAWSCADVDGEGAPESQLAHLSLRKAHKKSIQLQDALYSLHHLSGSFSVLEVLGLPGDVAIMVEEPTVPALAEGQYISFEYRLRLASNPEAARGIEFSGAFLADLSQQRVRINLMEVDLPGAPNVSFASEPGYFSVLLQDSTGSKCARFEVEDDDSVSPWSTGVFDAVEQIGQLECNRFTIQSLMGGPDVDLWYSKERQEVCQLKVSPPEAGSLQATIAVSSWSQAGALASSAVWDDSKDWKCEAAGREEGDGDDSDWAVLLPAGDGLPGSPMDADHEAYGAQKILVHLPAGEGLAKLAQGAGAAGMLPAPVAGMASRLVLRPPQGRPALTPAPPTGPGELPMSILDPELNDFSFSFTSSKDPQAGSVSTGRVFADLSAQRLLVIGQATNVSGGIGQVDTRLLYQGQTGWAYTMSRGKDFDECFSLRFNKTREPLPNPFLARFGTTSSCSPHSALDGTRRCSAPMGQKKRGAGPRVLEFVISNASTPQMVSMKDQDRGLSSQLWISDWRTQPADELRTVDSDLAWPCPSWEFVDGMSPKLASWELLEIFLKPAATESGPPAPSDDLAAQSRRLYSV